MRDQIHIEGTLTINWTYTHILNILIPFLRSQYMRDQIHIEGTLTINWTYTHIKQFPFFDLNICVTKYI